MMNSLFHLLACATCIPKDEKVNMAANSAILFMLLILVGVLGSLAGFIVYLARKAKNAAPSEPA